MFEIVEGELLVIIKIFGELCHYAGVTFAMSTSDSSMPSSANMAFTFFASAPSSIASPTLYSNSGLAVLCSLSKSIIFAPDSL